MAEWPYKIAKTVRGSHVSIVRSTKPRKAATRMVSRSVTSGGVQSPEARGT